MIYEIRTYQIAPGSLGEAPWLDLVGTNLVNHVRLLSTVRVGGPAQRG